MILVEFYRVRIKLQTAIARVQVVINLRTYFVGILNKINR